MALPFAINFVQLAGRINLDRKLLFTFLLHYFPEIMKLRRGKRQEEEHPYSEEAMDLKMERLKKFQEDKLNK